MIVGCEGDCRGCSQEEKEDCWQIAQDLLKYGALTRGSFRIFEDNDGKNGKAVRKIRIKRRKKIRI